MNFWPQNKLERICQKLTIWQPCRPKLATLLVVVLENGLSEFVAPKNYTFDTKILEIGVIGIKYI